MCFFISRFSIFTTDLFIVCILVTQTGCRVGVVYSPFVREYDNVLTNNYTRADVEVMLKLVEEKGYHEISTYGMGIDPDPGKYRKNETWRGFSSIVHTAAAAAEINRNMAGKNHFSVYLGFWIQDLTKEQQEAEINVGLEMAELANSISSGTVKGIIFPGLTWVDNLLSMGDQVLMVYNKTNSLKVQFGTRISDCSNLLNKSPRQLQNVLKWMDFVICQTLPTPNHLIDGPQKYFSLVTRMISGLQITMQKKLSPPASSIKFMLETGWPGGENLGNPHTSVGDMLQLWTLLDKWSKEQLDGQVFMHEAFDNPWKRDQPYSFGGHYGRWRHTTASDNSKSAYELKKDVKPPMAPAKPPYGLIFGVVFGLALFIALSVMILVVYRRVKRLHHENKLTVEEIRQFLDGTVTNEVVSEEMQQNAWMRTPYNRDFELQKGKFSIDKSALLGSGAFGSVYKGRIEGLVNDVAFKMTRPDCPVSALRGLLSEIKILLHLGKHENVVSICGAYTVELQNGIVYIATELCCNGSLEKFLRMSKSSAGYTTLSEIRYVTTASSLNPENITDLQLMRWALEIASAMEYISSKNIIHADLATRNVLLTLDLTAKVTDFGLSRRLYEYTEYVKKNQEPLPWKWLSPESLARLEFSTKSDVWSYGVTLWEIFSLGETPYAGLAWDLNFVRTLEGGLRLQRPPCSSGEIYEIMTRCWYLEPISRPDFRMLKDVLLTLNIKLQNAENNKLIEDLN